MSDAKPVWDTRTCREKQDQAIASLESQAALLAARLDAHYARVAALGARVAALEAKPAPPVAYTATPNQTFTWLPGDAWDQYTVAMDGEQPAVAVTILDPVRDDALDDDDGPDPFEDC